MSALPPKADACGATSDVIEGGLERALQVRQTFRPHIPQQRREPKLEVLDFPECV
jgi:hypothetical protein